MSIVIPATLDTKGEEVAFLKKQIEEMGQEVFVVDCAILGAPGCAFDISREAVADAAGTTIEAMLSKQDKNHCITTMKEGLTTILTKLYNDGVLEGVISVGGVQGTVIATGAMQNLPVGVPKYMVSTVANGQATFGPFVGASDMVMMHSVADIAGSNFLLNRLLCQAAGAIAGMVAADKACSVAPPEKVVGITMGGVTTPGVTAVKERLTAKGYEVIVFHCNGIGARAMEALVTEGKITGVIDMSPHDITDYLFDGLMPCDAGRLHCYEESPVPVVFVPGIADIILYNGIDRVPAVKRTRKLVEHNELHTHVKADVTEMAAVGTFAGERLGKAIGPVMVLYPRLGLSQLNNPSGPIYDPEADYGFMEAVTKAAGESGKTDFQMMEITAHINGEAFAEAVVKAFETLQEVT